MVFGAQTSEVGERLAGAVSLRRGHRGPACGGLRQSSQERVYGM